MTRCLLRRENLHFNLTKMRSNHSSSFFMKRVRLKYVIEPVENSVRDNFVLLEFYHDTPSFVWILESIIEH
jgi:hypothetical protein